MKNNQRNPFNYDTSNRYTQTRFGNIDSTKYNSNELIVAFNTINSFHILKKKKQFQMKILHIFDRVETDFPLKS